MVDMAIILKINDTCPVREVGTGLVIMAPEGDMTHSLEDIGTFIWNQFDGRRSLSEIADLMVAEYDVDREQAEADLGLFVDQLLDAGLVLAD